MFMVNMGVFFKPRRDPMVRLDQSQDSAQSGAFGVADAALGGEKANQATFGLKRWSDCMIATETNVSSLPGSLFPKLSMIFPRHLLGVTYCHIVFYINCIFIYGCFQKLGVPKMDGL